MRLSCFRSLALSVSLLLLLTAPVSAQTQPAKIAWQTDYAKAAREAEQHKRALFIDFYADWCGACRLMEQTTFADPDVISVLRQLTCVRVNVERAPKLALRFQVGAIPRIIVQAPDQTTALDVQGYVDAEALLGMLESAASQLGPVKFPSELPTAPLGASDSLAPFIEALGSPRRAARERAAQRLRGLGEKAVPPLLGALTHRHLAVRLGVWGTLSDILKPPSRIRFDPWATRPEREAQARVLRQWAAGKLGKQ